MGDVITGYPGHFILNDDTTSCPCAEHSPDQTARETLERAASASVGSPEYDVWFGLLLDRYRAEVQEEALRCAARKIRSHPECEIGGYGDGILDASFLIDPDADDDEDDEEEW